MKSGYFSLFHIGCWYIFIISSFFSCSCINRPERTWILNGGEQRVNILWKSLFLGSNFNSWCKQNKIQPDFFLPVLYPKNPVKTLKTISPKGLKYLPLMFDARNFLKPNQITKEDWRHTIFEWREHLAKHYGKYQNNDNQWHYLPHLYDNLPLDGSYKIYYFHTTKTYDSFNSTPSDYFLLVMVSPTGRIAGMNK